MRVSWNLAPSPITAAACNTFEALKAGVQGFPATTKSNRGGSGSSGNGSGNSSGSGSCGGSSSGGGGGSGKDTRGEETVDRGRLPVVLAFFAVVDASLILPPVGEKAVAAMFKRHLVSRGLMSHNAIVAYNLNNPPRLLPPPPAVTLALGVAFLMIGLCRAAAARAIRNSRDGRCPRLTYDVCAASWFLEWAFMVSIPPPGQKSRERTSANNELRRPPPPPSSPARCRPTLPPVERPRPRQDRQPVGLSEASSP